MTFGEEKLRLIQGALLHDIGKVAYRAGKTQKQNHAFAGSDWLTDVINPPNVPQKLPNPQIKELIEMVRFHHAAYLRNSSVSKENLAWLVCEADNIAAGTDRREIPPEGEESSAGGNTQRYDRSLPLQNVFNLVRLSKEQKDGSQVFRMSNAKTDETSYNPPVSKGISISTSEYAAIWTGMDRDLRGVDYSSSEYLQSLFSLLEGYLSYIPSSTDQTQVSDISLFDHSSLTAAIAACLYDYAQAHNIADLSKWCGEQYKALRDTNLFLLVHADLSGIQDFIYTISSKKALKSLRGRSFYLEVLLENIADDILQNLSLSRANLIYSGGGGFYMLLPNTQQAIDVLESARKTYNNWLFQNFSIDLYLGLAWEAASPNHFMYKEGSTKGTATVFQAVSSQLSKQKMRRYSGDSLAAVFEPVRQEHGTRECTVCGTSSQLVNAAQTEFGIENICKNCAALIRLGEALIYESKDDDDTQVFIVHQKNIKISEYPMQLPSREGTLHLSCSTVKKARSVLKDQSEDIVRIYSKNTIINGLTGATRLRIGDYNHCHATEGFGAVEFEDFVKNSNGIERIAVLRADVDNLGNLFSGGFRKDLNENGKYETLGRYASISRSLSKFFKTQINRVAEQNGKRDLVIVYSGGDDVFAVGAWDQVIHFAQDLHSAFSEYTDNKLTFSAGIGFYKHHFPIYRMAELTAELEHQAKSFRPGKDGIALFGTTTRDGEEACDHVYDWDVFKNGVQKKESYLLDWMNAVDSDDNSKAGHSFLYKILALISSEVAEEQSINIARLAYLVARKEPGEHASKERKEKYNELRTLLYSWATDSQERKQLRTAIQLAVYATRVKGE